MYEIWDVYLIKGLKAALWCFIKNSEPLKWLFFTTYSYHEETQKQNMLMVTMAIFIFTIVLGILQLITSIKGGYHTIKNEQNVWLQGIFIYLGMAILCH